MKIPIFGCNRTTSSLSHNDSSRPRNVVSGNGRRTPALARFFLLVAVAASIGGFAGRASAQTPSTPSAEPAQQAPATPTPEQPPVPPEQQIPQQPYLLQQPGRPLLTPATPPGTTIPAWTPPVAPAPSQTNIPAPFIGGTPGAGGPFVAPGIPSAFSPTVTRLGRATLEFHPTLRLSEEYSDNFFQASSRAVSNFRSTLGPGFSLLLNGARTFGTLATTVDLVHDSARNTGDDPKVFPSFNAAVRYALTPRLAITVIDTFVRSDSATTLDPNGIGIRNGRQTSMVNSFTTSLDWLIDRVATQIYYRNNWFINEDDDNTDVNANATTSQGNTISHILGVNASTRVATDYLIRAGYEFGRTDSYDGGSGNDSTTHTVFGSASRQFGLYTTGGLSTSLSLLSDQNTRIWNASVFGAYGLPTGFSISAAVGYSFLVSDVDDDGSISANVAASYRFARTVFSVGIFQDFRQTGQQGENFGTVESRSYFGSVLYQLTPFINAIAQVTYSENEPTGVGNAGSGTLRTLTYGGSVNWQVLRWLVANVRYDYTKRTGQNTFVGGGDNNSGDFAENRVSLNLFATF